MLGYALNNFSPFMWEIRPGLGLRWYGFAYVLAFLFGYWLYLRLARRGYTDLPQEKVGDFIAWGALAGVMAGGRIGYILFYDLSEVRNDPWAIFRVWEGGMSSHGGILGLILFTFFYASKHRLSWRSLGDNLVVVAPAGLFFGRCANFINGELYGRSTAVPWGMQFAAELRDAPDLAREAVARAQAIDPQLRAPEAVIEQARQNPAIADILRDLLPVRHASQLYEAALEGLVLFGFLFFLRFHTRQPRGVITGAFFIGYAVLRIIGELFREPDRPLTGPFTRGQFLSLFMILIGIAFVFYGRATKDYEKVQR